MARRRSRSYLLPHVLRTLTEAPITVRYPFAPLEIPRAYRGRVVVEIARCRGCGRCERDCPAAAIELERLPERGVRLRHAADRCAACGQCEESCPFGAIRLESSFRPACSNRADLQVEWVREGPPRTGED